MQVPGTHIHQPLSQRFLEVEQAFFTKKQLKEPGNVNRTLQEVLNDVITVWRSMDHQLGVKGHWETGVSNLLNGFEDGIITGEALEVWKRQGMVAVRTEAIADVDRKLSAPDGDLKGFADVRKVIVEDPGEYRYGEEFESEFPKPGESHWV